MEAVILWLIKRIWWSSSPTFPPPGFLLHILLHRGSFPISLVGKTEVILKPQPQGLRPDPSFKTVVIGEGKNHRPPSSPFRKAGLSGSITLASHKSALLPANSEQGHKSTKLGWSISECVASLLMHLFHYPHTFLCFGGFFCFSGLFLAVNGVLLHPRHSLSHSVDTFPLSNSYLLNSHDLQDIFPGHSHRHMATTHSLSLPPYQPAA